MDAASATATLDLDLSAIDLRFSRLRLMDPRAEARMLASMRRQGQLTPVVVGRDEGGVFLVDGFKRYRALQQLGAAQLRAQVLEWPVRSLKAAIVQLNGRRGLTSIEESWVLQSLHQDDALTQEQIGVLLGRHKSWVCRRLALVERLCDEALENLRLGLISARICRHLLLLPRGNQPRLLACVIKHHLSSRETARLVQLLRERPERQHEMLLWQPLEILDDRVGPRPRALTGAAATLAQRLRALRRKTRVAAEAVSLTAAAAWCEQTRQQLSAEIQQLDAAITKLRELVCGPTKDVEVF
jgi:ParB/RepB/Spo0J family partition protein